MAAGMGSRYGGLKQIDPVGPNGEIIMDYSIYDAVKAGFGKVVFIIKEENEETFRTAIGNRVDKIVDTAYVFQKLDMLPAGYSVPEGRVKPWGTAHAVLCCCNVIDTSFAVINADDFYGYSSFEVLYDFLKDTEDCDGKYKYSMAGFILENTLTENGHVARGICTVNENGYLKDIHERTKIQKFRDGTKYTEDGESWISISEGSIVSMNIWGFTKSLFKELEEMFPKFLDESRDNILKAEYFLPSVIDKLIKDEKATIKVLPSKERWYGVTYKEDKPVVKQAIADLIKQGAYPENLWEGK